MSEPEQGRSEQPTPYKLRRAREKGTVARGVDLGFFTTLAAFSVYALFEGGTFAGQIGRASRRALVSAANVSDSPGAILAVSGAVLSAAVRPMAFLAAAMFLIALTFEIVQTGFVFSTEPLRPDFSRLSPANGFKRIFSVRMLIETLKNLLKLAVYVTLAVFVVRYAQARIAPSISNAQGLVADLQSMGLRLLACFVGGAVLFAVIDQLIARRDFLRRMRMSRREIRRELREREGEPRVKQRRRRLHRELAKRSRSLRNIRGADVLITNPVHLAVALRYDAKTMSAPRIVSQGSHAFAQRLKALAFTYGVTIIENRALARALFYGVELDQTVPEQYYRAVADIYLAMRRAKARRGRISQDV